MALTGRALSSNIDGLITADNLTFSETYPTVSSGRIARIGHLAGFGVKRPYKRLLRRTGDRLELAGSTLSATRSKAAVANKVVVVNGCLLDFPRIPGQKRKIRLAHASGSCLT